MQTRGLYALVHLTPSDAAEEGQNREEAVTETFSNTRLHAPVNRYC